ncbi:MAG TPA: septum formation initiator family protein [Bryobacteraceae bacterium]|nr:septum formation initiator family protein [Bryobacteraceae bacterium]
MKERLARFAYVAAIVLVAIYAVATLTGPQGIQALYAKEREIQAQQKRNKALEADVARTQKRIDEIKSDPSAQERVVEERLNLVHPGDKVFLLPDDKQRK